MVGSTHGQKCFAPNSNQVETNSFDFFPIPSPISYCNTAITRGTWQGALIIFQVYPVISLSCLKIFLENAHFLRDQCVTTGIKLPHTHLTAMQFATVCFMLIIFIYRNEPQHSWPLWLCNILS